MKIANIDLGERALLLAPMEDVTDPSFRYMCKRFGADMVYTEFISSDGLIRDAAKSLKKLEIDDTERPVGIQIYGHLIDPMVEAARTLSAPFPHADEAPHAGSGPHHHPGADFVCGPGIRTAEEDRRDPQ